MKIQKKGTIKVFDLLFYGILTMMFFDMPYIKVVTSPIIVFIIDVVLCLLIMMYLYFGRIKVTEPILVMMIYIIYSFFITMLGSGRTGEFIMEAFPILYLVILFSVIMQTDRLQYVDKMKTFLFVITAIDLLTILVVPDGLYRSLSSSRNWLLGYETNRMLYSFPLLVLHYYSLSRKNLSMTLGRWIVPAVVFSDMFLSGGDAGSMALLVYILLASLAMFMKKRSNRLYVAYANLIYKYYIYFALFAVAFCAFVVFQNSTLLIDIAVNVFSKSATLSNRIPLWNACMETISEHFIFGMGNLGTSEYRAITGGYANPHNIIFSYMLTGGAIGLLLLIIYVVSCFRRLQASPDNIYLILGVYLILFLGLTSSTLSFSPFLFVFCIMVYDGKKRPTVKTLS